MTESDERVVEDSWFTGMVLCPVGEPEAAIRVLWISEDRETAVTIAMNGKDMPVHASGLGISNKLRNRQWIQVKSHPVDLDLARKIDWLRSREKLIAEAEAEFKKKTLAKKGFKLVRPEMKEAAGKRWKLIEPFVSDEPAAYAAGNRYQWIKKVVESGVVTKPTCYALLRKYWISGKNRLALEDDDHLRGAPGVQREATESTSKRGRPPKLAKPGEQYGVNVTEEIKAWIVKSARWITPRRGFAGAYRRLLRKAFRSGFKTKYGFQVPVLLPPSKQLSLQSYIHWLHRLVPSEKLVISRKGRQWFDLNARGKLGNAALLAFGPAHAYEIDATVIDVYVVNRLNRNFVLGRPIVYTVCDRFSRMIVGFHIGFDGPNFEAAMEALLNAMEEKVGYCAQNGIAINPEDWPCHYLCSELIADGGELKGHLVEGGITDLKFKVSTLPAFRGDWKWIVEKNFDIVVGASVKFSPGSVQRETLERMKPHTSKFAILDIADLTQKLLLNIIHYNTKRPLPTLPDDPQLKAELITATPLQCWNWGMRNRTGSLATRDMDVLRAALLPIATGTVTEDGVLFGGKHYVGDTIAKKQWATRAAMRGRWKIDIRFDRRQSSEIYWRSGDELETFTLKGWKAGSTQYTHEERVSYQAERDLAQQHAKAHAKQDEAEVESMHEQIDKNAEKKLKDARDPSLSRTGRTKHMTEDRQVVKAKERSEAAYANRRPGAKTAFTPVPEAELEADAVEAAEPPVQTTEGRRAALLKKMQEKRFGGK